MQRNTKERKIVISVNEKEDAKNSIMFYNRFIMKPNDRVSVTKVFIDSAEPSKITDSGRIKINDKFFEEENEEIHECLKEIDDIVTLFPSKDGIKVESKMLYLNKDGIGGAILSYAEGIKADMIIMGSRQLSSIKQVFIGSVSNYVINNSKIPVTISPPA